MIVKKILEHCLVELEREWQKERTRTRVMESVTPFLEQFRQYIFNECYSYYIFICLSFIVIVVLQLMLLLTVIQRIN